ncbi:MAG: vWA domain-containing protein [Bacteroidota bacterium]
MLKWALPGATWLSLAILPILFFYFLRMRFRSQPVSSIYIWSRLQNVTTGGNRLRRRSVLLLLLQVITTLAAVGAAAQPFLFVRHLASPGMVYLVDVSASMNAVENSSASGRTRLEMARELLAKEIEALDPKTNCMVFLCDTDAKPLAEPTFEHHRILAELKRIGTRNAGFDEAEVANQLQAWLGVRNGLWKACLISDGGLDLGGRKLAAVFDGRIKTLIIGKDRGNLGISGLRLQGSKASFIVYNGWPDERKTQVSLIYQERVLIRALLEFPPGLSNHTLNLGEDVKPGVYQVRLDQNQDALDSDDGSYLAVNRQRRFRVLQVGPANPFLESVLGHPAIDINSIPEFPEPLFGYWDLVIADRVTVPPNLKANLLTFEQIPPQAPVNFGGSVVGNLDPVTISHPLLRFVNWGGVQIVDGQALKVKPGLAILGEVAGKPVIAAWEEEGWRKVVCGFNLYQTNLGLTGSFPIFFQNLLQWCTPQVGNQLAYNLTVGEIAVLGEPPEWGIVNDRFFDIDRRGPLLRIKALASGVFQWKSGSEEGFLAVNPPFTESDLTPQPLHLKEPVATAALEFTTHQISLVQWPLMILLGCLFLEWIVWRGVWRGKGKT